ncbi:MAG: hypothetical protein HZC37_04810 [Burkholderiales bacterium]|nr:hypothetical protein [Burkholderiales bacterium]
MNRAIRALARLATLVLPLLHGCGTLNVSVDVLNPERVKTEMADEASRKVFREIVATPPGAFAARVDRLFDAYARECTALAGEIRAAATKLAPEPRRSIEKSAADLETAVSAAGSWRNEASRAGTKLETLAQEVRDLAAKEGYRGSGAMPASVAGKVADFLAESHRNQGNQIKDVREIERNFRNLVAQDTKERAGSAAIAAAAAAPPGAVEAASAGAATRTLSAATTAIAPSVAAVQQRASAAVAEAQRSPIRDGSLAASEFAYVVASAPPEYWKQDFNRAYGSGTFGNVDLVIRLNSTADFSVKGLLFDASKVAQVASKVMTQAVLLGAQMSGVPVTIASTGTQSGGDALTKASTDLAGGHMALARRQAQVNAQRDAMRALARSLLGVLPALESELQGTGPADAGRVTVHRSIDSAFDALGPLLRLQDLQ